MTLTLTLTPEKERLLQEQARQVGLPIEDYVQQAVDRLLAPMMSTSDLETDKAEQARLQALMVELQAEAAALELEPPDSPVRRAARENPAAQMAVEKFRKQGFHL